MVRLIRIFIFVLSIGVALNADDYLDMNLKLNVAKKQNKYMMLFFHIPHCPYCKRMLDKNFKHKKTLEEVRKNFILVDIYTKSDKRVKFKKFNGIQKEFAKFIGASAFPATIFLDKNGKTIHKAIGYRNINELLFEMKYISSHSYLKMELEPFIEKLEFEKD